MYKHLFLEGDSGSGKSTLLRELLSPYIDYVGGFSCQRLLDECGDTIAFRIVSPNDLRLATPYENTPETIFRTISNNHSGQSFLQVFEFEGAKHLASSEGKKLILLDEIGGLELKNEIFREALYDVLSGDIPCIGVIKQFKKACSMDSGSVSAQNQKLKHKMLEDFGCKILQFKRNDPAIIDEVKDFINRVLND